MGFFTKEKELSQKDFDAEMRKLELDIARQKKKNELLRLRATLRDEAKKNSAWGSFFEKMGEMGGNVKANLDKEAKSGSGLNFEHKGGQVEFHQPRSSARVSTVKEHDMSGISVNYGYDGVAPKLRLNEPGKRKR